jgi:hypothetical protein
MLLDGISIIQIMKHQPILKSVIQLLKLGSNTGINAIGESET